jgi:phosphate transport system protein
MAYTDANAELGQSLKARDKELDRLQKQMVSALSRRLEDSNGRSENLLHLIFIAGSIERIGDLAVNMGEDAFFLGEARDIRHESRKNLTLDPTEESADD